MATTTKRKRKPAGNGKAALPITTTEPEERALTKPGSPAVNPEFLIAKALQTITDPKALMDALDRFMAMRKELLAEWARGQYFAALSEFQGECPIIGRTKNVPNDDGSVRYSYTPIEEIARVAGPILRKHGFSWMAKPEQGDASVTIHLEAHHRDGHTEITTVRMPIDPPPKTNKSQATGSATTYATRSAFKSAFGIQTAEEDDDGAGSGEKIKPRPAPEAPRASQREAPRDVTPPKTTEAPKAEAKPETPAGRQLPKELAGVRPAGAACYWLLRDNVKSEKQPGGVLTDDYCLKQKQRIVNNIGNDNFLAKLKTEIELCIDEWKAAKT